MSITQTVLDELTRRAQNSPRLLMKLNFYERLEVLNVEKGCWHSLECLAPNSVLLESKDGAYQPPGEGEILSL